MRALTTALLAALLAVTGLRAQDGPAGWSRLTVSSCAAADSLLGPAASEVLDAEVHGVLGPDSTFRLRSGPFDAGLADPQNIDLGSNFPRLGLLPGGYATAFFSAGLLSRSRRMEEPMRLVLEDTLSLILGTPNPPELNGARPPTVPFSARLRADDLRALIGATRAHLEFLGERVPLRRSTLREAEAATRLAICHLASVTSAP